MTDQKIPETQPEPKWFIDEGIPGAGERPEWLQEKYKTVADLARSNQELEKKIGTAPEEYDVSNSKFIDAEYGPFQDFLSLAREKKVPKEVVDKMMDSFDKYMDEFSPDMNEEVTKLGENAKERIQLLNNWAKANLSDDSFHALTGSLRTAEAIKALEELRGKFMTDSTMVPNGNDSGVGEGASLEDVKNEMATNLDKYKSDPNYRKEIQGKLEVAARRSGYVDKVGG